MTNRLASALSPYLRQHADNPVDWSEWGPEAFVEARRRDVPVFLSIGYAACHWCHVMAHESFEDEAVAEVLNTRFVPVKVDREERPDVDAVYMDVTVALTGHGGWPMSVWLTPDGHAFHAGTYYPPTPRAGSPSFLQVLDDVTQAWEHRHQQVLDGAPQITAELAARGGPPEPGELSAADVDQAVGSLVAQLDERHGGFGGAPKFPPSMVLDALVARAAQSDGPVADEAWRAAALTLERMARGGLYDQLGGGFARYSVDAGWVVPHFEKMLYDNALLLAVYARASVEADRRSDAPAGALFRRVAIETVEWLDREMLTVRGPFAASLDADSDDVDGHPHEGAYYVWTPAQLRDVLGDDDGARAATLLGVTERGTFEPGASTVQLLADPDDAAWFAGVRDRLSAARRRRPAPARDDKVVAAWNGWLVAALAEAGVLLDRPEWVGLADRAARAVLELHRSRGSDGTRLARVSLGDTCSPAPGAAEDYAGLAHGLLVLAAVTGDGAHLDEALGLLDALDSRFAADDGGIHDAEALSSSDAPLVRRPRDLGENATPSGTSAALRATRLAHRLTGDDRWRSRADALARGTAAYLTRAPRAAGWSLADAVAEHGLRRPVEVAIMRDAPGDTAAPAGALTALAWRQAPPGSVVVTGVPGSSIPLLRDRTAVGGAPTAYVCHGHVCDLPTTAVDALQRQLG